VSALDDQVSLVTELLRSLVRRTLNADTTKVIQQRLDSISLAHQMQGDDPTATQPVREAMAEALSDPTEGISVSEILAEVRRIEEAKVAAQIAEKESDRAESEGNAYLGKLGWWLVAWAVGLGLVYAIAEFVKFFWCL
jgi:hypothetical protein